MKKILGLTLALLLIGINAFAADGDLIVNGNVGIGTTTPAQKLSVAGTIESTTGGFKFPDATTQTTAAGGTYPSFSVHKGGTNQIIPTTTFTLLTWSTEEWDSNSNFANNRFTPTVAGKYLLTAAFVWSPTDVGYSHIYIYKNGTLYRSVSMSAVNWTGPIITVIVDANGTTDYFEVYAYQPTGIDKTIQGAVGYNFFQGHKLP